MTMNRHEPFEELISASLSGDVSAEERVRLDAHLETCEQCRATLAAFADQRRIVAGLRHVTPPADLSARVRVGVESGAGMPWWRRPAAFFAGVGGALALVAGAVLALVVLNGTPDQPQIGNATPTPSAPLSTASALVSASPLPSATPVESASSPPQPTATPIPASPQPDLYLALTGPVEDAHLAVRDGASGDEVVEVETPAGPPIAAQLSPDGQWLAYITQLGESGLNEVRATRIAEPLPDEDDSFDSPFAVGDTVVLGESVAGSAFLEQLTWSPDGRFLAFTLSDQKENETDAWIFRPAVGSPERVTDVGNAYAGSWLEGERGGSLLWVSTAGASPASYLLSFDPESGTITAGDPADSPFPPAEDIFQPLISPNGAFVIFWNGRMEHAGAEWLFNEGGRPWLAQVEGDNEGGYDFTDARELFSDLTVGRDGFASASIAWGPDSDSYAVWGVQWTGTSQGPDAAPYPDEDTVYFSHATDARGTTRAHALDDADIPDGLRAIDVKVAPTGRHLVLTVQRSRAGVLDPPRADLLLVTRNTGDVADGVETLASGDDGWFGPAGYDAYNEASAP